MGLCVWINKQKMDYKAYNEGKKRAFFKIQIKALEKLGIQWTVRSDKWNIQYNKLVEYKHNHGDTMVPTKNYSDKNFANWVACQRHEYKRMNEGKTHTLTPERIKLLKDIEFVFNVFDQRWEDMYKSLETFKKTYGHVNLKDQQGSDLSLAKWA